MLSLEWLLPSCSELKTSKFIKDKVDTYGLISVKNLVVEAVLKADCWQRSEPLRQTAQSLAQPGRHEHGIGQGIRVELVSHGNTDQPGVQEQGQSSPLQGHEGKRHQPGLVELNRLSPGV